MIDARNELKKLQIKSNTFQEDFSARAQEIPAKCQDLGLRITKSELVFYTVCDLKEKITNISNILKT